MIDGVSAHGERETQIIPADTGSAGREIQVTDQFRYSPDLRINLIIRNNDPRTGSVTRTVTQIARTDPDPSRFQIPEGYTPADAVKGTLAIDASVFHYWPKKHPAAWMAVT
jgi:hypothetical protein